MKRKLQNFKINLFTLLLLISAINTYSQERTVTGKVTSLSNKQALIGATVIIKGSSVGVVTNINGTYTINVPDNTSVLQISYIGFITKEIEVGKKNVIDVSLLQDITQLDEIMVVGYGTQKKSDITGSLVSIKSKDIVKQPGFNATQSIQGKAAGVQIVNTAQPGSSPQIRIRGTGTVLGGANPIFVVDGVITTSIDNISSNDIESINILKDASSSAIYGVRGANGVILITTKSGGENSLKVNYNNYTGFRKVINKVELADTRLYADYTNHARQRGGLTARFSDINNVLYTDGVAYNTDWFDAITRNAFVQNHSISLSGGNKKNSAYFSINYYLEEGILKKNDVKRLVFRLNDTYSIGENIKVSANINYSTSNQNGVLIGEGDQAGNTVSGAFSTAYVQAPYVPVFDANNRYGFSDVINNVGNPVAGLNLNNDKYWKNQLQGTLSGEANFLQHFNFKTSLAFNFNLSRDRSYTPLYQIDPSKQFTDRSTLKIQRNIYSFLNGNNFLKYENRIDNHAFSVLAGFTIEEIVINRLGGSRNNVPNEERLWFLTVGDQTTAINNNTGDKSTRISYVARTTYSFKDKYLFTGTIRREGSSKFGKNNRFGLFPAVGLGWRISEESFLNGISWLDNLKLRGSWGRLGNDRIPSNQFAITIGATENLGAVFGTNQVFQNGATVTQSVDEGLTWETVKSYDIGLEFGFFEGKLSGEIDYYNKLTQDALVNKPTGAGEGDVDLLTNAGDISNTGIELMLSYRGEFVNGLRYTVGGNVTFNKNNVEKMSAGSTIDGGDLKNGRLVTRTEPNQEIGSFWVYKTNGIYKSREEVDAGVDPNAKPGDLKRVDTNNDGAIDNSDRIHMGSFAPKTYFGLNISLEYKNFDFSIDTYGNIGNKVFNGLKYRRFGGENITADLAGFWTPQNPNSNIPGASNDIPEPSDYYVEDGDFFRINNITLGYSVKTKLISKLRLYASAQNPFMWQKYSGYTPELPQGILNSGIELDIYPSVATYLIGLNITL